MRTSAISIKSVRGLAIVIGLVLGTSGIWAATASEGISGEVTAQAGGAPVPQAKACAAEFAGTHEYEWECTTAIADGTYQLDLPPGDYRVKFDQGNSGQDLVRRYYPEVDRFGEAAEVTVAEHELITGVDGALAAGGFITGRVIEEGSYLELQGIEVCSYWEEEFESCLETNSNGFYEMTGIHPGRHVVEFWAPELGYETQFAWGKARYSEAEPVWVSAGQWSTGTNAVMSRFGTISGHVYAATSHQPLGKILVCAVGAVDGELQDCEETGPTGAYQLRFVPGGTSKVAFSPEYREFFPEEEPNPDGWPTQFWNLKPTLSESDVIDIAHGASVTGIDGLLGYVPPSVVTPISSPSATANGSTSATVVPQRPKGLTCKKAFVKRRVKGKQRCLRRPRHHRRHRGNRRHRRSLSF